MDWIEPGRKTSKDDMHVVHICSRNAWIKIYASNVLMFSHMSQGFIQCSFSSPLCLTLPCPVLPHCIIWLKSATSLNTNNFTKPIYFNRQSIDSQQCCYQCCVINGYWLTVFTIPIWKYTLASMCIQSPLFLLPKAHIKHMFPSSNLLVKIPM